jgi:hypothetical protein
MISEMILEMMLISFHITQARHIMQFMELQMTGDQMIIIDHILIKQ